MKDLALHDDIKDLELRINFEILRDEIISLETELAILKGYHNKFLDQLEDGDVIDIGWCEVRCFSKSWNMYASRTVEWSFAGLDFDPANIIFSNGFLMSDNFIETGTGMVIPITGRMSTADQFSTHGISYDFHKADQELRFRAGNQYNSTGFDNSVDPRFKLYCFMVVPE